MNKKLEKELRLVLKDFRNEISERFNDNLVIKRIMEKGHGNIALKWGMLTFDTYNDEITEFTYAYYPDFDYSYTTEDDYERIKEEMEEE